MPGLKSFFSPHRPIDPQRFPIFYGWVVMAVATLGVVASIPGQTIGFSVFVDYLIEALGLERTQLSLAYMAGTITSACLLPFGGRLLDRYGARPVMVVSAVGFGLMLALMSRCDGIAAALGGGATVAFGVVFVGFFLIRFLGQGMLAMVARAMLGKWFNLRRGLVFGLLGTIAAFCFSYAPHLLNGMTAAIGWRATWLYLAIFVGVAMTLLAWVFYRDNPEECGLEMDGPGADSPALQRRRDDPAQQVRREFTAGEAMRDYAFWIFNLGLAANALIITAVSFHISSLGEWRGLTRTESFHLFVPMAFVSIPTTLLTGWLCDRIRLKYLMLAMLATMNVGLLGMPSFETTWGFACVAVGFGMAGGAFGSLSGVVWPRFYGRRHLGAISGVNMSTMVFASALGPWLLSYARDLSGSFRLGLFAMNLLPAVLFVLTFWAENPQQRIAAGAEAPAAPPPDPQLEPSLPEG